MYLLVYITHKLGSREARMLTGRPGRLQGGQAAHRETRLTGRPGFLQGCRAFHKEAGPLTESPGLSQGGQYSHR